MGDHHLLKKPTKPTFTAKPPKQYLENWDEVEDYLGSQFSYKEFVDKAEELLQIQNNKYGTNYTLEDARRDDTNNTIFIYFENYDRMLNVKVRTKDVLNDNYEKELEAYNKRKAKYEDKLKAYEYQMKVYARLTGEINGIKDKVEKDLHQEAS